MKFLAMLLTLGSFSAFANHGGSHWSHQTEAILNAFTGNTEQLTIGASQASTTSFGDGWNFSGTGEYNYGEVNGGTITARNWQLGARLGKSFSEKLEGYYQGNLLSDEFQQIDSRLDNEIGILYNFINPSINDAEGNETNNMGKYSFGSTFFFGKLGYRFTVENFSIDNITDAAGAVLPENRNNAVVGLGFGTALTSSLAFLSEANWVRTLGEDDRNLFDAFAGFRSTLSKSFALKFGYEFAYNDNAPIGVRDTDGKYIVSVLATY